jgi:hypothetical protein
VGDPVRHAQYRQELADLLGGLAGTVAQERADASATKPTLTVQWTGSTRDRDDGWHHAYDVEIAVGPLGRDLDELVAAVATRVADWKPNTSRARAAAPSVNPVTVLDGDINYPAVIVHTTVTEPAT